MSTFVGSSLVLTWTFGASGTLDLGADNRSFSYEPSCDYLDETAGTATAKEKIAYMKDGVANWSGVLQAGSLPAYGSALVEGTKGTLVWAPEGSAAGKYKGTAAFWCGGMKQNYLYNNITEVTCAFAQTGPRTEGTA